MSHNVVGTTNFTYDAVNRPATRTLPNMMNATATYDGLDRMTRLQYVKGTTNVADFQYQFNMVDQITQLTDAAGAHNFTYDALERIKTATHPNQPNENYNYDTVGNRTSSHRSASYGYQPLNRMISADGLAYTYDANGNLSTKTDAGGVWQYFYDRENRLINVMAPGGVVINYKYDALGRRIERSKNGTEWTRFSYDGLYVVRDLNSDGSAIEYGNADLDDKLWQRKSDGTTHFLVTDHQGSTRALTDGTGGVVSNVSYDAFGNSTGSTLTRYDYTGRERDADTGLLDYRARWYDPVQGRFISEDPIGLAGGINLYSYVLNDPLSGLDPLGLKFSFPPGVRTGVGRLGKIGAAALAAGFLINQILGPASEINEGLKRPKPNNEDDDPDAKPTPKQSPGPQPCPPGGVPTFRVQGGIPPNASKPRLVVDETGGLSITGDDMLFININQEGRALEYLARRGEGACLICFELRPEFVEKLRSTAVEQKEGASNPALPQRVDKNRAPDQYGIPKNLFDDFLKNVVPCSGRVYKP